MKYGKTFLNMMTVLVHVINSFIFQKQTKMFKRIMDYCANHTEGL